MPYGRKQTVAPAVFDTAGFAMKGGAALDPFQQDMPRLSVDIEVVFVTHRLSRQEALGAISNELAPAQARVEALGLKAIRLQPNCAACCAP